MTDEVDEIDVSRRPGAKVTPPRPKRTQVLALSGGGYRGLYTAHFLQLIEAHFSLQTARRFDLYFPVHEVGGETLIDGGLIANAPEMQGVTEALSLLHAPLSDIYVLAVGTAARRQGAALTSIGAPSTTAWLMSHGLFEGTLAAQEALSRTQCAPRCLGVRTVPRCAKGLVPGCLKGWCQGAKGAKVPRVPRCQGCQGAKGARVPRVPSGDRTARARRSAIRPKRSAT